MKLLGLSVSRKKSRPISNRSLAILKVNQAVSSELLDQISSKIEAIHAFSVTL